MGPAGPLNILSPEDSGLVGAGPLEWRSSLLKVQLRCPLGDDGLRGGAPSSAP